MSKRAIYINLFILLMLITACVQHSYVSRVPALADLLENYHKTGSKVLVVPVWHKLSSTHEYYYFDSAPIVFFDELQEIHNKIPAKKSFGILTLTAAPGKWEKFSGLYLIFEDGLTLYMQAGEPRSLRPTKYWSFTNHAWIGPKWQDLLIHTLRSEKVIDYSIEPSNFFWSQQSTIIFWSQEAIKSSDSPGKIKNKLSVSVRKKIIKFLEDIKTLSKRVDDDIWKSRAK